MENMKCPKCQGSGVVADSPTVVKKTANSRSEYSDVSITNLFATHIHMLNVEIKKGVKRIFPPYIEKIAIFQVTPRIQIHQLAVGEFGVQCSRFNVQLVIWGQTRKSLLI